MRLACDFTAAREEGQERKIQEKNAVEKVYTKISDSRCGGYRYKLGRERELVSPLATDLSRRTERISPSSYLLFRLSARALSNDRPHPSPPAKSVVESQTRTSSSGIPLSAWHRHLLLLSPSARSTTLGDDRTQTAILVFHCVSFQPRVVRLPLETCLPHSGTVFTLRGRKNGDPRHARQLSR